MLYPKAHHMPQMLAKRQSALLASHGPSLV
jgi:hypothetical protein